MGKGASGDDVFWGKKEGSHAPELLHNPSSSGKKPKCFKMVLVKEIIKHNALEVHASPLSGKIKSALQENRHTVPTSPY